MTNSEGAAAQAPKMAWIAIAAALLFNLIPIIGVIAWGWSVFALIFLYWAENVLIGVRTFFAMAASGSARGDAGAGLGLGLFFALHYGLFCFVHGMFVILLFGPRPEGQDFVAWSDVGAMFANSPHLSAGFVSIALWQGVLFILFLARGEAARSDPKTLMGAPYPRMIVLHVAIVLSGFVLMGMERPVAGLVLLALLKTAFDIAQARGKTLFKVSMRSAD
jgi:hypothetical protein